MKTWLHKSSFCRQISDQNQKSLGTTRGVHKTTVQCEVQCACYKLFFIFEIINVWNTKGVYFGVVVLESIPVSIAWRDKEHFYSPLDDMLVHCRINTHPPPLPHLFRLWYTTYLFSGVKGEDYCGSMVSCPGTQHDKPLRAWKLPESHRLTKTQQFSLVCVCSQVSVSIHSLCRCSDTYSYINGEKMVNFLVCESVFFFFLQQLNHQHQWSTSLTFHSSWSISERQKTSFMLSRYNFFTTCNYGFVLVPLSTDFNWKIYRGVKFLKV